MMHLEKMNLKNAKSPKLAYDLDSLKELKCLNLKLSGI